MKNCISHIVRSLFSYYELYFDCKVYFLFIEGVTGVNVDGDISQEKYESVPLLSIVSIGAVGEKKTQPTK